MIAAVIQLALLLLMGGSPAGTSVLVENMEPFPVTVYQVRPDQMFELGRIPANGRGCYHLRGHAGPTALVSRVGVVTVNTTKAIDLSDHRDRRWIMLFTGTGKRTELEETDRPCSTHQV